MKACRTCGIEKDLTDYYKHPKMADGHLHICKGCTKNRVRKHRDSNLVRIQEYDRNRSNAKERARKYKEYVGNLSAADKVIRNANNISYHHKTKKKYPEKCKSVMCVNNAIHTKKIVKPSECSQCGCTDKQIQGHHWSYLEENWLDVIWLCANCHTQEHIRLREVERNKQNKAA